jgi:phage gp36-like protein
MYVTFLQLAEIPGARELSQVASAEHLALVDYELMDLTLRGGDRSGYTADQTEAADAAAARITQAIASADALINGYLQRRSYTLPLSPVPAIVAGWSRAITRYELHKSRISDEKSDPIARDYRDALKLLQLTADGKFSLGIDDPQPDVGVGQTEFCGDERVFTRGASRGFR